MKLASSLPSASSITFYLTLFGLEHLNRYGHSPEEVFVIVENLLVALDKVLLKIVSASFTASLPWLETAVA